MILITSISVLECGIAILQAYVFIILVAIYFEEHFGFTSEDTIKVSSLSFINNIFGSLIKVTRFLRIDLVPLLYAKHFFIMCYNRRFKGRFFKSKNWRYTIVAGIFAQRRYN